MLHEHCMYVCMYVGYVTLHECCMYQYTVIIVSVDGASLLRTAPLSSQPPLLYLALTVLTR